jgi:hypothetical protein
LPGFDQGKGSFVCHGIVENVNEHFALRQVYPHFEDVYVYQHFFNMANDWRNVTSLLQFGQAL